MPEMNKTMLLWNVFFFTCVGFCVGGIPIFYDPDASWHLMAGLNILEHGVIPKSDPWSFTADGHTWYLVSWGWDILAALFYRVGGVAALSLFVAVMGGCIMALLALHLLRLQDAEKDALGMVLLMVGMVLIAFMSVRPQMAAFIYTLGFQYVLCHRARLLWLPLIMIAWGNMHSSFMVGFTIIGAHGLQALLTQDRARFRELVVVGLACVLAACINPYGIKIYEAIHSVLGGVMYMHISEWKPFRFDAQYPVTIWLIALFSLALTVGVRASIADVTLTLIWFVAMLMHQRNSSFFVLLSAPLLLSGFNNLLVRYAHLRHKPKPFIRLSPPARFLALLFMVVLLASNPVLDFLRVSQGYSKDKKENPEPAIREYQKYCQQYKFLTDYNLGGNIIYLSGGSCPVFIDGREGTAYPHAVLQDYIDYLNQAPDWQERILSRGVKGIFMENASVFVRSYEAGQYHDRWRQIYKDDVASIYLLKP